MTRGCLRLRRCYIQCLAQHFDGPFKRASALHAATLSRGDLYTASATFIAKLRELELECVQREYTDSPFCRKIRDIIARSHNELRYSPTTEEEAESAASTATESQEHEEAAPEKRKRKKKKKESAESRAPQVQMRAVIHRGAGLSSDGTRWMPLQARSSSELNRRPIEWGVPPAGRLMRGGNGTADDDRRHIPAAGVIPAAEAGPPASTRGSG